MFVHINWADTTVPVTVLPMMLTSEIKDGAVADGLLWLVRLMTACSTRDADGKRVRTELSRVYGLPCGTPSYGDPCLDTHFTYSSTLGYGGFADVWQVDDPTATDSTPLALKFVRDSVFASMLEIEGAILTALASAKVPNVPEVVETVRNDDGSAVRALVMRPVGIPLLDYLHQAPASGEDNQVLDLILRDVQAALVAAADAGYHHDDVRWANMVVITDAYTGLPVRVVLIDWGLAQSSAKNRGMPARVKEKANEVFGDVRCVPQGAVFGCAHLASALFADSRSPVLQVA